MIRAAIVGTGWIAHEHVLALQGISGVEIALVSSSNYARATAFAEEHSIPIAVAPHREALASPDVDVVHVCTKNVEHFDHCRSAMENGKHVIAEKPLATTSAETGTLLDLARAAGIVHCCNYGYRAYPIVQHARALIERGDVGDVRLAQRHYMQDWLVNASDYNWRLDPKLGGASAAFGDIGSHWFDLVEHVTGRRVTELHSRLRTAVSERVANLDGFSRTVPIQVDDSGVVSFELDNGGLGSAVVSQVAPGRKNHLWFEISGSEASVSWSQEDPDRLWIGHHDQANERPMRDVGMAADEVLPPGHPFGWRDAIRRNLRTAYQQILEPGSHRAMPFATFADGHRSLQLVEALMRSSEERIAIVPPQVVEASKSGG